MHSAIAIINPAAGGGNADKEWQSYSKALKSQGFSCNEFITEKRGHAIQLARDALGQGTEMIFAVGGDGTVNEIVNGFFKNDKLINSAATLGIIPWGSGADFVRTFKVPNSPRALAESILQQKIRTIDVGRLKCRSLENHQNTRYFLNVADLGYGGALLQRYGKLNRILPGSPAYFLGLLVNLISYSNPQISYRIDNGETQTGIFNAIIAANGKYFGGGMWIAPRAELDNGLFEIVLIGNVNKLEVIANLRRIYNGTLCEHSKVTCLRGKKLEAWSEDAVLLDADGELPGKLPATFEIVPGAVRMLGG